MEAMFTAVFDSLLLFALAIPVVMKYRILPVEGTPYWLFGVLFFILGAHCFVSVYPDMLGSYKKHLDKIKMFFVLVTIAITLGGAVVTAMFDRARTAPVYGVHDIILQQESAMRFLVVGKNPYKETYFGTTVEMFNYDEPGNTEAVNPALYHFVMPPWYVLFPFIFYYTSIPVVGFFDGRMALLFTMATLLAALWYWYRDKAVARIAMIMTALSPSVTDYFIEGRSDVFALSWLMVSLVLLRSKRYVWSGVMLALSLMSKQTIWFILPFYVLYVWLQTAKHRADFWRTTFAMTVVSLGLAVPFMVWDFRAFFESVVLYLTGNSATSYPVSGYGLGMVLHSFGFIRDIHAYYPFIFWQAAVALPLLAALFRWLSRKPSESRLVFSYAVFLMVYWYLSRYFNNSHLGFLSMLFVLGGLKAVDESTS
jgi:hypothetical protein